MGFFKRNTDWFFGGFVFLVFLALFVGLPIAIIISHRISTENKVKEQVEIDHRCSDISVIKEYKNSYTYKINACSKERTYRCSFSGFGSCKEIK